MVKLKEILEQSPKEELKALARAYKSSGYSKLPKDQLIELILQDMQNADNLIQVVGKLRQSTRQMLGWLISQPDAKTTYRELRARTMSVYARSTFNYNYKVLRSKRLVIEQDVESSSDTTVFVPQEVKALLKTSLQDQLPEGDSGRNEAEKIEREEEKEVEKNDGLKSSDPRFTLFKQIVIEDLQGVLELKGLDTEGNASVLFDRLISNDHEGAVEFVTDQLSHEEFKGVCGELGISPARTHIGSADRILRTLGYEPREISGKGESELEEAELEIVDPAKNPYAFLAGQKTRSEIFQIAENFQVRPKPKNKTEGMREIFQGRDPIETMEMLFKNKDLATVLESLGLKKAGKKDDRIIRVLNRLEVPFEMPAPAAQAQASRQVSAGAGLSSSAVDDQQVEDASLEEKTRSFFIKLAQEVYNNTESEGRPKQTTSDQWERELERSYWKLLKPVMFQLGLDRDADVILRHGISKGQVRQGWDPDFRITNPALDGQEVFIEVVTVTNREDLNKALARMQLFTTDAPSIFVMYDSIPPSKKGRKPQTDVEDEGLTGLDDETLMNISRAQNLITIHVTSTYKQMLPEGDRDVAVYLGRG